MTVKTPTQGDIVGTDRIEKRVVLRAPRTRVWRALTIVESGFDRIPLARRAEAFRMNDNGWTSQVKHLARYVE